MCRTQPDACQLSWKSANLEAIDRNKKHILRDISLFHSSFDTSPKMEPTTEAISRTMVENNPAPAINIPSEWLHKHVLLLIQKQAQLQKSTYASSGLRYKLLASALAKVHKLTIQREKRMANSRIAKFVMEVAPPQFVSVMRHRTAKMLDTISEEEKDVNGSDALASTPRSFYSCSAPSSASAVVASDSKYFLRGVQIRQNFRSLRINKP